MDNNFNFTYANLKDFLLHMKTVAPVIPLRQAPEAKGGFIILRHDVDLDIYPAYILGKLEKKLGIRSSFFIMTTCPYYNPLSKKNRRLLRQIIDDGHEIGLHFDPQIYPDYSNEELRKMADLECRLLESITKEKVKSVSLHEPASYGNYIILEGYINAYHEDYFSEEKYISDSYMEKSFLNKDPFQFVKRGKNKTCQVLLHPCQFTEKGGNFKEILEDFIIRIKSDCDKSFKNLIRDNA